LTAFIKEEEINEIRERNNIVEVISEYVTLKKSGRLYKACCPFHQEKTPSFMVDPVKQLFHCFGCDAGGNVFNFLMKMDNVDFPEAVKALADRAGYTIVLEKADTRQLSKQTRLFEINNQAMLFYQRHLLQNREGQEARDYLKSRDYHAEIAKTFGLGVAFSQWNELIDYLRQKGFSPEEIETAGLAIKGDKGSFYDRFRSRIMFPIFDSRGRAVGFGGRIFGAGQGASSDTPKYVNSPETPVYHKSKILYWLNEAKSEIVKQSEVLVVEGYTDVISLYQSGIRNVVATCGTAFTPEHLKALSRFTEKVVLVFDADAAGKAAAERGLELLGEEKVDIFVLSLPSGFDPADFVTQKGKEAFLEILEQAISLVEFCLESVVAKYDIKTPNGRVKAAAEALPIIAALPGEVAHEEYLRKLSDILGVSYDSLYFELNKSKKAKKRRNMIFDNEQESSNIFKLDAQGKAEFELLKFVMNCPEHMGEAFFELNEESFSLSDHRSLFSTLRERQAKDKPQLEVADLLNVVDSESQQRLMSKLMLDFALPEDKEGYFKDILAKLKEFGVQRQINLLRLKLERLNPTHDPERYDVLFEELIELEATKRDLRPQDRSQK